MDPVLTVIPTFVDGNAKNYRFAHLSGEPLCTENIKPFLRLLPCKTSGLGTLIFSNDFFNTPFHSLSIHATKQQDDFNVELVAQIVKSKLSLLKYGGQFAQLTSLTDNLKCSVAKEQKLTHNFGTVGFF
uniref:Uncharacterized protein n=1 Tax=Panagrolaimus sp. JU765 TaxID=591449 RepID=A0AC34R824_9BILA